MRRSCVVRIGNVLLGEFDSLSRITRPYKDGRVYESQANSLGNTAIGDRDPPSRMILCFTPTIAYHHHVKFITGPEITEHSINVSQ